MINVTYEIERLLSFSEKNGLVSKLDKVVARNELLDLFKQEEPYNGTIPEEELEFPTEILDKLMDYAADNELFDTSVPVYRELMDTKVMGIVTPRASEVAEKFVSFYKDSPEKATDFFYKLSVVTNYIRMSQISKNIIWKSPTEYGELEITINLSKPEKDPKQIALERSMPSKQYPKCLLCLENIGYAGRVNFPARQTHRVVPVTLGGEAWYVQYSPYVYYNEHCIVFSEEHRPMQINRKNFEMLLNFVEQLPHYMCGSNADLPIVGGSILSHDHFQGGRYVFPMQLAETLRTANHNEYKGLQIELLKWPLSVIRASADDAKTLLDFAEYVLNCWRLYSDVENDIMAFTEKEGNKTPHNTITPIARKNEKGRFELDLVLRNNRTSDEHPDGIFHPHKEIHHIKKENIGLIEVMGLAVLPARLSVETELIKDILTGKTDISTIDGKENVLFKHLDWVKMLIEKYGINLPAEKSEQILKNEIAEKFKVCLEHSGVFKQTGQGQKGLDKFLESIGCIITN